MDSSAPPQNDINDMNFQLDFESGSFYGEKPLEVFENLSPAELKEICKKIGPGRRLAGFLSYEWGAALEGIGPAKADDELKLPLNWFGLYKNIAESPSPFPLPSREREKRGENYTISPLPFQSSFTKERYLLAVQKILAYLKAGDCYQVNLTQRFTGDVPLSYTGQITRGNVPVPAWQIYQRLREISPAPYAAYIDAGSFQILSSSPELFLEAKPDGTLITKPIKGTRPRGKTPQEDEALKEDLETNPKDRAELLMITDLERNDLGKVSLPGSVHVPEIRTVETFAQVHHLVSTVEGLKRPDKDIVDVLTAMMPGGSITGAPKIRAMEIIKELETVNRSVYTGAIGWIGPDNTACFNIAIRTILIQNKKAYFSAGGGIVIDSDPEMEYEETLTKASGMMQALQK